MDLANQITPGLILKMMQVGKLAYKREAGTMHTKVKMMSNICGAMQS